MELKYEVKQNTTIRKVLQNELKLSYRFIKNLKLNKKIFLNGNNNIYLDEPALSSSTIKIDLDTNEDNNNIIPSNIKLNILYEDELYLIVNKPAFMPVHPSMEHYTDSLSNGVKYYFDEINLKRKIRPVNRLDKNTSGIVIFAKNEFAHSSINILEKKYLCIVAGKLESSGLIDKPISRKDGSIIEREINPLGDKSLTKYRVLKNFKSGQELSLLECILLTGRTHQIRVHMSSINHSILGDDLYGVKSDLINRQALHAYKIKFIHPILKKEIEIYAPIPQDMFNILKV